MANIVLKNNQIEEISKILGGILTGTEISTKLNAIKVTDTSGESTKWRRIYGTFLKLLKRKHHGYIMLIHFGISY